MWMSPIGRVSRCKEAMAWHANGSHQLKEGWEWEKMITEIFIHWLSKPATRYQGSAGDPLHGTEKGNVSWYRYSTF